MYDRCWASRYVLAELFAQDYWVVFLAIIIVQASVGGSIWSQVNLMAFARIILRRNEIFSLPKCQPPWALKWRPGMGQGAGCFQRCEPDFGFVLRREVSDENMFRIVSGHRKELRRAHHHLSLIALSGMSRTETLEG